MKKKASTILLALCMLCTLVACGSPDTPSSEGTDVISSFDGTLKVGISDPLGSYLKGADQGDCHVGQYLVFDSIFYHDPATKEVYSDVLEDWYYEDETTFVLKLKDNVYFSNGEKATSEDVLFSFTNYAERRAMTANMFITVDAANSYCEDELTAVIKFTQEWGPGVDAIDPPLLDKSWCEEVGWDSQDWLNAPVGSGPYEVVEYVTDSHTTLRLRDDYWGDETMYNPEIKEIVLNYYPEIATMFIDLQTGAIDLALNIAEADYARGMEGIENVTVDRISTNEVEFLCMDTNNEYLKNEDFRKAIAYGVDWSVVADAGFGSLHESANSLLSSHSPYYAAQDGFTYDVELAKQYLDASGFSGSEITLHAVFMADADQQNMAEALKFYLDELGITLELEFFDFGTALSTWLQEGGTAFNFQESATGSPSGEPYISLNCLMQAFGTFAVCTVEDDEFNELAMAAMTTIDEDERAELFAQLQAYNQEHAFAIPMLEGFYAYGYDDSVIAACDFGSAIGANLREITLVG